MNIEARTYAHDCVSAVQEAMEWQEPSEEERPLIALYALLAFVKGKETTAEDVHDAWSVWTAMFRDRPDHPSLVPFAELSEEIQALDDSYVEGIRGVARALKGAGGAPD